MIRVETIGDATLYLGDCREILPTLGKVDAVVTDPPYGVLSAGRDDRGGAHGLAIATYESYEDTYENFVSQIVPSLNAAMDIARRAAVFSGPHIHEQRKPDAIGGVYVPAAAGRHQWGYKNLLPVLFYGTAPSLNLGARWPTAIKSVEAALVDIDHPCPKPDGWMSWLVSLASDIRETVLDPFMGSGTTGVACAKLSRKFVGIEIEPKYFDIACRRIEETWKQPRLFEEPPQKPKQGALGL